MWLYAIEMFFKRKANCEKEIFTIFSFTYVVNNNVAYDMLYRLAIFFIVVTTWQVLWSSVVALVLLDFHIVARVQIVTVNCLLLYRQSFNCYEPTRLLVTGFVCVEIKICTISTRNSQCIYVYDVLRVERQITCSLIELNIFSKWHYPQFCSIIGHFGGKLQLIVLSG